MGLGSEITSTMERRTFITGLSATTITLLAGCSGDEGTDSTSTSPSSTSMTSQTTSQSMSETTTETSTAEPSSTTSTTSEEATTTGEETTTGDGTSTTGVSQQVTTVSLGEAVELKEGLQMTVSNPRLVNSYSVDGEEVTPEQGNVLGVLTLAVENTSQNSQSLPEMSSPSVRTSNNTYELLSSMQEQWESFASTTVSAMSSSSMKGVFEVPKSARYAGGLAIQLKYEDSGETHIIRWQR